MEDSTAEILSGTIVGGICGTVASVVFSIPRFGPSSFQQRLFKTSALTVPLAGLVGGLRSQKEFAQLDRKNSLVHER
jgi:hypothetical protein